MSTPVQLAGLHPRSEQLVELTRSFDRGRVAWDEVDRALSAETVELVQLQQKLRFDYVSDGGFEWPDSVRPLAHSLTGLEFGARYSRWFDTNTFYKKPIVKGRVNLGKVNVDDFLKTQHLPERGKWKLTIPGPYTFSELSKNEYYAEKSQFVKDVAVAEHELVRRLFRVGVSLIQLSEPCLVYRPYREEPVDDTEIEIALQAIRHVVDGLGAKFLVQTSFGDASPILKDLLELPVGTVGFDLFETDSQQVKFDTDKDVTLGIVDSRESQVEDPRWIATTVAELRHKIGSRRIGIAPNSDLRFLPRETADKKAAALAEAARIVEQS